MAKFFDNVTGRQKVVLLLGGIILLIGARVLFPEAAEWFATWVEDMIHHLVEFAQGFGGTS